VVEEASSAASNSGEVEMREERVVSSSSKSKTFQKIWALKWPWLENCDDGMRCTLCVKHKSNVFTRPG
jgi:hypothetical protein